MTQTKTALMIDDNEDDAEVIAAALEMVLGYTVIPILSVEEAKKHTKRELALVLIDGLNGRCFEVYNMFEGRKRAILTADENIVRTGRERGMKVYLKNRSLRDIMYEIEEQDGTN